MEYALDLINRQQAEIERLINIKADELEGHYSRAFDAGYVYGIKEFAERLCEGRVSNDPVVIAVKAELKLMKERF